MTFVVEFFCDLAMISSVVVYLSPLPTMYTITRTKSTGHMPFLPLVALGTGAHGWMVYRWVTHSYILLLLTCAFGMLMSIGYVVIYYRYTTEKPYVHRILSIFGLVIMLHSIYAVLGANGYTNQNTENVGRTVGYICDALSVVTYLSPLEKIRLVFQHRSAVFIPIALVVCGVVNSASWVTYTLLDLDWLVCAPSLFLLVLGLLQMALYWVFHPSKHPLITNEVTVALSPKHKDQEDPSPQFVPLKSPLQQV